MLNVIETGISMVTRVLRFILATLLGIMLVVSIVEVVRRYFFGQSFSWSEELVRYLIIWISFLGAAMVFRDNELVCFDVMLNKFTGKKKTMLLLLVNTICVVFIAYMFSNALETVMKPSIVMQKSIGLQITMAIPYAAAPIGMGLMLVFGLWHYVEILCQRGPFKPAPVKPDEENQAKVLSEGGIFV